MMERLDKLMVDRGLVESRTQAQKLIEAGVVEIKLQGSWYTIQKTAHKVDDDTIIRVGEIPELRFVSRAGLKLDLALNHLQSHNLVISVYEALNQALVVDIGQSAGGFTDCLLQYPVSKIVGLDVGHGQLAEKLRNHPLVIGLEGINAREMPLDDLLSYAPNGYDWAVMDVSFISQTLILPNIPALLKPNGYLLSLVKPQFEVGSKNIAKGGIVRDVKLYDQVRNRITECALLSGFEVLDFFSSGIEGGDGNQEFFMFCRKP